VSVGPAGIDLLTSECCHSSELCIMLWFQSALPDLGHISSHLVTYNVHIKLNYCTEIFSASLHLLVRWFSLVIISNNSLFFLQTRFISLNIQNKEEIFIDLVVNFVFNRLLKRSCTLALILTAFPRQQWLSERVSMSCLYVHCLACWFSFSYGLCSLFLSFILHKEQGYTAKIMPNKAAESNSCQMLWA
jgi:hypothetical protein